MSSALASYASGEANAQSTENSAKQSVYGTQLGLYAGGPRQEVLPHVDQSLSRLVSAYKDPSRGYIRPTTETNAAYDAAIAAGMSPSQAADQMQSYMQSGALNLTPAQVTAGAQGLLDPSLINAQVDAFGRDISRNLGENVITGIRLADVASGNLGSSRGGVQEAIARRGAEDRIADFRGELVGQALQQSQGLLQDNIQNQMSGYGALSNAEEQQLGNLMQTGQLQQSLSQSDIDAAIAQRDYGVTQEAQMGSLLRDYASVGNLVPMPTPVKATDYNNPFKIGGGNLGNPLLGTAGNLYNKFK